MGGTPRQGRWLAALLLLAAVFCIHGLQCATGHGWAHPAGMGLQAEAAGPLSESSPLRPGATPAMAAHAMDEAPPVPALSGHPIIRGSMERGPSMELGVCLGAILGGIAALVALPLLRNALRRATRLWGGSPRSPRGWARAPAPPELSSLCLLRI